MIVYAPSNLPKQAPLVVVCHGMNQDANYQKDQSRWEEVADTAKFVVVYPNGIGDANGANRGWDISGTRDIDFVLAIINEMHTRYGINKNRVYLTGFSMGGMFTYHCANRIADKIAAFAPVSGYRMGGPNATASRPVPILHTHGTGDDVCVYSGAPTSVKAWAKFNGCDATPQTIKPYPANKPNSPAKMEVYRHGKQGVEVALLTLADKGHWWSRDENQAHTTREVWNFCQRYSLGKPEPELLSVMPENQSFDLTASADSTFTLVYSDTVNTTKAQAILKGRNGQTVTLKTKDTSDVCVAYFVIPAGTTLENDRYTLTVSSLLTSENRNMQNQSFTYEYGKTTPAEELKTDTTFNSNLGAEQESIHEGIPSGWRRIMYNGSSNEVVNGPAADVAGVRMKYFQKGGDFDEGFYLSARDQSSATLSYGANTKYMLQLDKGDYQISFNSTYWSEGAMNAGATFNFRLKTLSGTTIIDESGLKSGNTMRENTNQKITGSKQHIYNFSIDISAKHAIYFEMSEGWNSIILGNIKITSLPSYAEQYKGTYTRLMNEAREAVKNYDGQAAITLQKVIDQYAEIDSKSPSAYTDAIAALQAALKTFYATSLSSLQVESNKDNIYYNLLGQQINKPSRGIYLCNGRKVVIK